MLASPPAEFSTARRLKPARQPDFTAASRKRVGGAAEGSTSAERFVPQCSPGWALHSVALSDSVSVKVTRPWN